VRRALSGRRSLNLENQMRRRLVLAGGAAVGLALATGAGPAIAHTGGASPRRRAYSFLDAAMDGYPASGPIRLAQSYTDQAGLFSTAFVYDNALAILAYLADGRVARARALGDALLFAQVSDPQHSDGRLRQAYNVGPYTFYDGVPQPDGFVRADGKANVGFQFGFTGTAAGDMAWAGIALAHLARRTGSARYRAAAVRIGEWITTNTRSNQPLGGYRFGVDGANQPLPFSSIEHNIDLVALFGLLGSLTGRRAWRERRAHAEAFVGRMFEPAGRFFWTGTNDGTTINRNPIPEDTQTWSYLALGSRRYAGSVDWAVSRLKVVDTATRRNSTVLAGLAFEGVTFSSASLVANEDAPIAPFQPHPDRSGVWFEGTAHVVAALRQRRSHGDERLADRLVESIERAQDKLGAGQTIGGRALPARAGVVSASSPLDTGFGFGYYPYRHVGATTWYLLAGMRRNPFRF
jgi:hypothetical protein